MPRSISRCRSAARPVTQFAAGCAVCGTDLAGGAGRAGGAAREAVPPAGRRAPPLLAGWFAYDADRDGRVPTRNLMILLLGFSLVGLVAYAQIWGGLFFGI
jgi:hypothetical protein